MSDHTRVLAGRVVSGVAVTAAIVGCFWIVLIGRPEALWRDYLIHNAVVAIGFGAMVWMVVPSQPRNRVVWISALAAVSTGLTVLGTAIMYHALSVRGSSGPIWDAIPADLPVPLALLGMLINSLWLGTLLVPTLVVLHLPDGELPSPRWRWLARTVWALWGMGVVGFLVAARPSATVSYGDIQRVELSLQPITTFMSSLGFLGMGALIPFCVAGMVVRYRNSAGVERQQLRWVAWGATIAAPILVAAIVVEIAENIDTALLLLAVALVVLVGSFAVSIGKYRLYDIDVVISRTLVYGALAVLIAGLYVGIVVGLGSLLGLYVGGEGPDTLLGLAALVVIPLVFQPARRWLERWANRVVFGRRATPYEVLSGFSQRVAAVDPETLAQVARSLTEGTTAQGAGIWATDRGGLRLVASWPSRLAIEPDSVGASAPIAHHGEELGMVGLISAPGQSILPTDERLLGQVASGLGLALRNQALTADLESRIEQLRDSRRRIVAVQDRTRRQLERDLHDGAQQRLVALKIKLGLATAMADREGAAEISEILAGLRGQADQVIETVREFARGIYPPLLEAEGLTAALSANFRKVATPINLEAPGLGRYPREQEATVYFLLLTAVAGSVVRRADSVDVMLREEAGDLIFEVRDDGGPVDPDQVVKLLDRVDAASGEIHVDSAMGRGTTVSARLPVVEEALFT